MIARTSTCSLLGIDAIPVEVEVDVSPARARDSGNPEKFGLRRAFAARPLTLRSMPYGCEQFSS